MWTQTEKQNFHSKCPLYSLCQNKAKLSTVHERFQASAAPFLKPSIFWNLTQRRFLVGHRRFGTPYRLPLQESSSSLTLEDGADIFSRNLGDQLPTRDASHLKRPKTLDHKFHKP